MPLTRRSLLTIGAGAVSFAVPGSVRRAAAQARTLKISHQFPGGTIEDGDFRDRLCRRFASELAKRSNGALAGQVYPNSSLMKTVAQFSALRKGALDMSLYPLSYAGGELPETNIGLMPGLVSSYKQGAAWKKAPRSSSATGTSVASRRPTSRSGLITRSRAMSPTSSRCRRSSTKQSRGSAAST